MKTFQKSILYVLLLMIAAPVFATDGKIAGIKPFYFKPGIPFTSYYEVRFTVVDLGIDPGNSSLEDYELQAAIWADDGIIPIRHIDDNVTINFSGTSNPTISSLTILSGHGDGQFFFSETRGSTSYLLPSDFFDGVTLTTSYGSNENPSTYDGLGLYVNTTDVNYN